MTDIVHFVGLGSMGLGMAQSALRAGFETYGHDPDTARRDLLGAAGGRALDRASPKAGVLVCVVLNAAQTRDALFGAQGWAEGVQTGGVILGCATVAPEFAREMEDEAARRGLHYLDAPISGGAVKAAEGRLSIMASGRPEAFARAEAVLAALAETVHRLGDCAGPGSARSIGVCSDSLIGVSRARGRRAPCEIGGCRGPASNARARARKPRFSGPQARRAR